MKKSLIIIASLFCLKGFSQSSILVTNMANSATVTPNSNVDATTTSGATTAMDFDIKNTSASTKSYNVKRYDILLHTNADAHFCYAGSCYPDVTTNAGPVTLNAGQSASQISTQYTFLTTDLDEAPAVGYSLIKYTFINTANSADSVQFSLRYNPALGISEISNNALSSLELFPNPATDATILKITSQKAMDAKVIVYNALGAIVSEMPIAISEGKNKIDLNLSTLNSGVYFTQVKMASSIVTKRLIVK